MAQRSLSDGLTQKQGEGVGEGMQVQDVSQMLLAAVKRGDPATNGTGSNGSAPIGDPAGETEAATDEVS